MCECVCVSQTEASSNPAPFFLLSRRVYLSKSGSSRRRKTSRRSEEAGTRLKTDLGRVGPRSQYKIGPVTCADRAVIVGHQALVIGSGKEAAEGINFGSRLLLTPRYVQMLALAARSPFPSVPDGSYTSELFLSLSLSLSLCVNSDKDMHIWIFGSSTTTVRRGRGRTQT